MAKLQIVHDTEISVADKGRQYLHCAKCLDEWQQLKRKVTPKKWARQQVSITGTGLQVWCTRHDCNIDSISFVIKEAR